MPLHGSFQSLAAAMRDTHREALAWPRRNPEREWRLRAAWSMRRALRQPVVYGGTE